MGTLTNFVGALIAIFAIALIAWIGVSDEWMLPVFFGVVVVLIVGWVALASYLNSK